MSSRLLQDDDPSNDLSPTEARDLFLWRHRAEGSGALGQREGTYGDKPDYSLDVSLSGPIPGLNDFTFFASYKTADDMFAMPVSREFYEEDNGFLKLSTRLTPTMNSLCRACMAKLNSFQGSRFAENNDYVRSGEDILYTDLATGDAYGDRSGGNIYWPSSLAPFDIYRTSIGISFDHTLSPSTFYNVRISATKVKNFAGGPDFWRDTTTVRYFGNTPIDETPYGFWWEGGNKKMFDGMVYNAIGAGARDYSQMNNLNIKFDLTSQVNKYNQVKMGVLFNYDDLNTNFEKISQYAVVDEIQTKWRYFPYRIGAYIQDKLEFEGMIANIGVRLDYSNANADWFSGDPYSEYLSAKYKEDFNDLVTKSPAESRLRISPRLGVSHPISEDAKLYFQLWSFLFNAHFDQHV